jgi:hypothetical protein
MRATRSGRRWTCWRNEKKWTWYIYIVHGDMHCNRRATSLVLFFRGQWFPISLAARPYIFVYRKWECGVDGWLISRTRRCWVECESDAFMISLNVAKLVHLWTISTRHGHQDILGPRGWHAFLSSRTCGWRRWLDWGMIWVIELRVCQSYVFSADA